MLIGTQYGSWTVLRKVEPRLRTLYGKPRSRPQVLCRCICGTEKVVLLEILTRGASTKCKACAVKAQTRHGHYTNGQASPEYIAWQAMKARCSNPRNASYTWYGGRGISVCKRWNDFAAFLEDMGARPSPEHTIERRNSDGDYTPENCYWGTLEEQHNNRRDNRFLLFKGETLTIAQWAGRLGWHPNVIHKRLTIGWTVEKALTFPLRTGLITANGETLTVGAWAKRLGVDRSCIYTRLDRGWTPEQAVTIPKDATRGKRHIR